MILDTVPLEPEREYDKPAGPHVGHGAALRVPVSSGPAAYTLEGTEVADRDLIAAEPRVDPLRQMELGTEWDADTIARARVLDREILPPKVFVF